MLESIIFYGIISVFFLITLLLFFIADKIKKKNKKLSFVFFCLGINVAVIPVSYFIGVMATDAPDSTVLDFYQGFLFIQGIPLLLFMISIILLFINKKDIKNS